jgi:uncharacterized protein
MNQQDRQAIDDLFQHLSQTAGQAGSPDPEAQARVQQHLQQGPPGLLYQMAQTLVGQQAALRQLRAQLADAQQRLRQAGPPAQSGAGGYGPPYQQQQAGWQRAGGGQGFLAGAGQIALGVGGGILAAEALGSLFGGDGLFGGDSGDQAYEQGYDQGFDQGYDRAEDDDRQDDSGQDQGGQDNGGYDDGGQDGGYDDGGYDSGGFDGGDFGGGDF